MKKIRSQYLDTDIEVDQYDAFNEFGDSISIITHASLSNVFLNLLPGIIAEKGMKLQYDIKPIFCNEQCASFMCTLLDSNGRKIIETGEAQKSSMKGNIDKNNIVRIAKNRAMDSALIKYLDFPKVEEKDGKIFSTSEGVPAKKKEPKNNTSTSNTLPQEEQDQSVDQGPVSVQEPSKWESYLIQFGMYKGKSLEETYRDEKGKQWIKTSANNLYTGKMNSKEGKKQLGDIIEFLKEKGDINPNAKLKHMESTV